MELKRIGDEFQSLSDTFSQWKTSQETGVAVTNNLIKGNFPQRASWSRGHFNSWQTATTTASYIWAANHSKNKQKHSRSGRMKRSLSLFRIFLSRERTMCCENVRIKDVDSYKGKFRSTRGNSSVVSDKTVGGEGKKDLGEKHTRLSFRFSHSSVQQKLWQRFQKATLERYAALWVW